jgi:Zn-dependent peptidase ImmA (M78 family)
MHSNTNTGNNVPEQSSVLAQLRSVLPAKRKLRFDEALRLAELQANKLLEHSGITEAPVPAEIVTSLPRITIGYEIDMPCSGVSVWDAQRKTWIITLNALEPDTRHRISILHEYKHIIDHGSPGLVDLGSFRPFGYDPIEYVAEYFAGCTLMPKRLVKRAWGEGLQRLSELADFFEVSPRAMSVRLAQLGLREPLPRCIPRSRTNIMRGPSRYYRSFSPNWPAPSLPQEVTV